MQQHGIPGAYRGYVGSDGCNHARTFVSENLGKGNGSVLVANAEVRVSDPDGVDLYQYLVWVGLIEIDGLHQEGASHRFSNSSCNFHDAGLNIDCECMNSERPSGPNSRPTPDCLTPPKGTFGSRSPEPLT